MNQSLSISNSNSPSRSLTRLNSSLFLLHIWDCTPHRSTSSWVGTRCWNLRHRKAYIWQYLRPQFRRHLLEILDFCVFDLVEEGLDVITIDEALLVDVEEVINWVDGLVWVRVVLVGFAIGWVSNLSQSSDADFLFTRSLDIALKNRL